MMKACVLKDNYMLVSLKIGKARMYWKKKRIKICLFTPIACFLEELHVNTILQVFLWKKVRVWGRGC